MKEVWEAYSLIFGLYLKPWFEVLRACRKQKNITETNSSVALECHFALIRNRPLFGAAENHPD
jgi:hypothetical protein